MKKKRKPLIVSGKHTHVVQAQVCTDHVQHKLLSHKHVVSYVE